MTWQVLDESFSQAGFLMRLQLPRDLDDPGQNLQWELMAELKSCPRNYCFCESFGETVVWANSVWVCGSFGLYSNNQTFVFGIAKFSLETLLPEPVAYSDEEYVYVNAAAVGQFER